MTVRGVMYNVVVSSPYTEMGFNDGTFQSYPGGIKYEHTAKKSN